jgi:TrmH family RNA methyltransferase
MALLKSKLKLLSSLKLKKFREQKNLFVVEGEKIIWECTASDWKINEAFFSEETYANNGRLLEELRKKKISISIALPKDFEKFSNDKTPSQIAALVERKKLNEIGLLNLPKKRFLILQNISDPGNFGAIIRSADWFGVNGVVCDENSVELTNPKVVKGSMGSIFHLPVAESVELIQFCEKLKAENCRILSTSTTGKNLSQIVFPENCAVIFGHESSGVSDQLNEIADEVIAIPKFGKAESLNVSIAASIILYEWTKRSTTKK